MVLERFVVKHQPETGTRQPSFGFAASRIGCAYWERKQEQQNPDVENMFHCDNQMSANFYAAFDSTRRH